MVFLFKKFSSVKLASKETGINHGNICACCRNANKGAGGYFWSYKFIDNPNSIKEHLNGTKPFDIIYTRNEKPVYKLSLNNNVICRYDSIKSASENTGIPAQEISQACKNNKKVTRRFKWKYA
jgi:hypothetical protein